MTVIDSKRYSQEILGKLENFRQSPNSSELLLLAQNSRTLQNWRLQPEREKENDLESKEHTCDPVIKGFVLYRELRHD